MASRSGPRAQGTDGSDFQHREQIVNHYKTSAELKLKLRRSLIPHMFLTVVFCMRFLSMAAFGTSFFGPLEQWEKLWLLSGFGAFVGFGSLAKNDTKRMIIYLMLNVVFGLAPLAFGAQELVSQMRSDFKDLPRTPSTWKDSPMKMALVAVCIMWQMIGEFHGIRLLRTWRSMGDKKKN